MSDEKEKLHINRHDEAHNKYRKTNEKFFQSACECENESVSVENDCAGVIGMFIEGKSHAIEENNCSVEEEEEEEVSTKTLDEDTTKKM